MEFTGIIILVVFFFLLFNPFSFNRDAAKERKKNDEKYSFKRMNEEINKKKRMNDESD